MKLKNYVFRKSLIARLAILALLVVGGGNSAWAQSQLFKQDFNDGTLTYTQNVAYTKTSGLEKLVGDGDNLFTSIQTNNKNSTGIAINNSTGGNNTDATGIFQAYFDNTGGYWYVCRSKDFATTAPTAIKMTVDVWVNIISGSSNTIGVQFAIGDGFTDGTTSYGYAPMAGNYGYVHSGFGITAESSPTIAQYASAATDIYETALNTSTWLSITWIINNTGKTLTYDNPTGSGTSTVNNDCFDLWLKTSANSDNTYTRVVQGQAASRGDKDLQELYIGSSGGKKMEFRMDNLVVYDITPASCISVDAPTNLTCSAHSKNSLTFSWTAAANASSYDVSLYNDAECTNKVTTSNVTSTSKEFKNLSGSKTYYCKVQSKGDGSTYCEEGNVTDAASGTTDGKDYTVTVVTNNDNYGIASCDAGSLDEGETTTVTATANSGYKFRSWAVSGTGAELSSTTDNPTTLTMGTADATVTATFSALYHYTITYAKGANGTGDAIANGDKTEDADFELSSSTYTYASHLQKGWATTDGGDKAYDLGGTYTANADLTLYPYWIEQYTLTYNANGGTGTMNNYEGTGSITLAANAFTKSGHTFIGWATSQSDADSRKVTYSDKDSYTLSADETLYAVWGENFCELTPATSGTISYNNPVDMQTGSYGATLTAVGSGLAYEKNGLKFGNSADKPVITLNDYLKVGSVISVTLYAGGSGARGLYLYTNAATPKNVTMLGWSSGASSGDVLTFQYNVTANDGLAGTNSFQLWRYSGNTNLQSLIVTDCQPGGVISASGWNTYSSNKVLDLSTISGGSAYIATDVDGSANSVKLKKCTDIVAAGTGLMIQGTTGATFTINAASGSTATLSETNLMVGLPNGGNAPVGSYVFGWPTNGATAYGFYYVNNSAVTLGAGKAYLSSGSGSARLSIALDDMTGIDDLTISSDDALGPCYNLQGQRLTAPKKGLYIVNGKKHINK